MCRIDKILPIVFDSHDDGALAVMVMEVDFHHPIVDSCTVMGVPS
jgi:hypothetical protein